MSNCLPCANCLENCDDTFECIDQYITNVINGTINNNFFCNAVTKCVNDNIDDLEFCPIVYECLKALPGYTDTGTIFLTSVDNVLTWIDLTSIGTNVVVESGNCIDVSGTGSSLDPLIFDLNTSCFRALFSAGDCLNYNVLTGEFSLDEDCIQDLIGLTFIDTTTVDFTYDDIAGTVSADVNVSSDLNNAIEVHADGLFVDMDPRPAELDSGGVVTWLQDYDFYVNPAEYHINGIPYSSPEAFLTLSPADPSLDRFDVIYVDADGIVKVLEGTPSLTPAQPGLDLGLQLGLGVVFVEAGSSSPVDLVEECLYQENGEWTTSVSDADINANSANTPCIGSVGVEATNADNGDYLLLQRGTSFSPTATYNVITFRLNPKAGWNIDPTIHSLKLQFRLSGVNVGAELTIAEGSYNFDTTSATCQIISIPTIQFSIPISEAVDELKITVSSTSGSFGFFLDGLCLQGGIFGATESDDIHNQFFGPQTPGRYWIGGNARIDGYITSPQRIGSTNTFYSSTEKFGYGAFSDSPNTITIGQFTQTHGTNGAIAIGNQASATDGVAIGNFAVANGHNLAVGGSSFFSGAIAIGGTGNALNGSAVGYGSEVANFSTGGIALGALAFVSGSFGGIAIGTGTSVQHNRSAAFGTGAVTTEAFQVVFGSNITDGDLGFNSLYFGSGVTSIFPQNRFWTITGASGTNIAGDTWTIAGAKGTGNASTGSRIIFQTSDVGASGATLQSLSNKVEIVKTGALIFNKYGINTFAGVPTYTLGVDASGNVVEFTPGFGSGTVTSFSSGNLSPLFTTNVATATTTPALTFSLSNAAGGTVFGNSSSSTGSPLYTANPVLGRNGITGTLGLSGTVGGTITIKPQANAGTYNFNLPITVGPNGWLLTSGGGGASPMTWTDPGTLGGGGGGISANNGLTENVPDNIQLGGSLVHDTSIEQANKYISFLNSGNVVFLSDPLNQIYKFGDIDSVNNGTFLEINDASQTWTATNIPSGSTSNILYYDSVTGAVTYNTAGISADDGLTTSSSTNVRLFGDIVTPATLLDDRYLDQGVFVLNQTGTSSTYLANYTNTIAGGLNLSTEGISVVGISNNSIGVYGQSLANNYGVEGKGIVGGVFAITNDNAGVGLQATNSVNIGAAGGAKAILAKLFSTSNTVKNVIEINRRVGVEGGTPATNMGSSIDFTIATTTDAAGQLSNQFISKWTTATHASRVSQAIITGVNNAVTADLLTISGNGETRLNKYGVGSFTSGTGTYLIATKSDGTLMEFPTGGLPGGGNLVTADEGLTTSSATNVRLFGTVGTPATLTTDRYLAAGSHTLNITYNSIAGASGFKISSTSTSMGTGTKGIEVSLAGTANVGESVYGIYSNVTGMTGGQGHVAVLGISPGGVGVYGISTSAFAVLGQSSATGINGHTIAGYNNSSGNGMYGESVSGIGVYGNGTSSAYGGYFISNTGVGAYTKSLSGLPLFSELLFNGNPDASVQPVAKLAKTNTGTVQDGSGLSIDMYLSSTTTSQLAGQVINKWTTAANASRESSIILNAIHNTSTVDVLTLAGDGSVKLRPITATEASAITPAEAMFVFVSNTNGTFTSIGPWCYYNGAWHAL